MKRILACTALALAAAQILAPPDSLAQPTNLPGPNVVAWGGWPAPPADLTNAVALAGGSVGEHNLALRADGTVTAWGLNDYGQCDVPLDLTNAVALAGGASFSLALRDDGTVVGWGRNQFGQCDAPAGLSDVVGIAAGSEHGLAVKEDGTVVAWGAGKFDAGSTANSNMGQSMVPPGLRNVVAVTAGGYHSAALRDNGSVVAWGNNRQGQATPPEGLNGIIALAASLESTLALKSDGTVVEFAWATPHSFLSNIVAVAAANGWRRMALQADGRIVQWGWYTPEESVPADLPPPSGICAPYLAMFNEGGIPPTIFRHPRGRTAAVGSTARFSVRAFGPPPLSYRWFLGDEALAGATNAVLSIANVSASHAGSYTAVVTSGTGASVTSRPAALSVLPALDINLVPAITLRGEVGWTYRLDYINAMGPTNAWNALATVTLTNNPQFYFDVSAIGQPARYYRLVETP